MFSLNSNNKNIQKQIEKYKISEKKIFKQASVVKDQCSFFMPQMTIKLKKNSALLLGQLFQDKSVIKNNSFLTLLDYKKELKELAIQYSKIYFLKHPLMSSKDFQIILDGLKDIANIQYIEKVNTYHLLSQTEIKAVIGLSSSVLKEAQYFGKKSIYLYKPVLNDNYIHIYKKIYTSKFWNTILDLSVNKKNIKYLVHDNYMRYNFNIYYAYKDFMNDFQNNLLTKNSYKTVIKLYNFCENLDKSKKYILYGYGSVGKLVLPLIEDLVVSIIDKSLTQDNVDFINNIPVITTDNLKNSSHVIVTPLPYYTQISKELRVTNCKIINPFASHLGS